MKPKFGVEGLDFSRLDEPRVADAHTMEGAVELLPPKGQKLHQRRKFWCNIVVLPDIGLQETRVIRQPIKNFRRSQTVACQLLEEIA